MLCYTMLQEKCKICGKIVEGFSNKDLDYRMIMHNMKHRKEKKQIKMEINIKRDNK